MHSQDDDLVIYDRGYCSYQMLVIASQAKGNFLVRCPDKNFRIAADMLAGKGSDDVIAELTAPQRFLRDTTNQGLPKTLTVRFIRVILDTGEYEVLSSSLLDQELYTVADCKELYWLRWGD